MVSTITICMLGLSCAIALMLTACIIAGRMGSRKKHAPVTGPLPRVSLLKPMKSMDDGLRENLESYFTLDYPDYEIIFGVDTLEDSCVSIVRDAMAAHPDIPASIIATGLVKRMNPKIETLACISKQATASLFWVTDSNTRVDRRTLSSIVREARDGASIVFSPIQGDGSRTLGSLIENMYLNYFVSGSILSSWHVTGIPVIVGKSMLIARDALERMGGFVRFKEYLAEDYMMGELFASEGFRVSTNGIWITNWNVARSVKGFCARVTRWEKLRFHINRPLYISEILANPLGLALASLAWQGPRGLPLAAGIALLSLIIEYVVFFSVTRHDRKSLRLIALVPVAAAIKSVVLLFLYPVPFFSSAVNWRGRRIGIGEKSRIKYIHEYN